MPGESFDWTLMRSFLAVLDGGSVTRAARTLGAQQPTLSRHIAELEAQLATPLFERTGRGLRPTNAALAMAEAARAMADGAGAVQRALAGQRNARSGSVRLTTSDVAACWLLPPVLAALQRAEPGIQVELVVSNELTNLLQHEADIALRMVRPVQTALVAKKLADLPITACAHTHYLDRAGEPHAPAELRRHTLIGHDRDDTILRGFAKAGLPLRREDFALRTDHLVVYNQLIAAGAGIGFATVYAQRAWPGVRTILPVLKIPPLPCWLVAHRGVRASHVVRRVFDFLAAEVPRALAAADVSRAPPPSAPPPRVPRAR